MTKSGDRGKNLSFCCGVKACHFSKGIQAASGERSAPFGSLNPPEESKTTPNLCRLFHNHNWAVIPALELLVSPPVGGIIIKSPFGLRSKRKSRLS